MPEPLDRPDVLPLSKADYELWTGNISAGREIRAKLSPWWDANLENYGPCPDEDPDTYGSELNTNRDFTLVERKKPDLFFQKPDVTAIASPLFEDQQGLLDTHAKILNEKLGPDGVNVKEMMQCVLFDVLCTAGTGWTKMGYESVTLPVPKPEPQPGDVLGLSQIAPASAPPAPTPVPIFEDCFWVELSPKQVLIPSTARSKYVDRWPWVGAEFEMSLRDAKRRGWVPDTFKGSNPSGEMYFDHGLNATSATESVVRGVEIWYKSSLYRDDQVHPQHLTQLILIDGVKEPAVHRDSPYQTILPTGALSPDSLIGFPIHALTIRTRTDAPFVMSDCSQSRPQVNELNRFRAQMIEFRDAMLLQFQYNTDTLPVEAVNKMIRGRIGSFIGVPGEAFTGEGAIKELPHGTYPRENFTFNDYIDNDIQQTHGLGPLQTGATQQEGKTATHDQIQQSNVNARLGFERGNTLEFYIAGVTKYSTLVQRFLPVQEAAQIVGQEKAAEWDSWRKTIPASLAFTAMPDSALQSDLAYDRQRAMDEYTFFANDPFINRIELLKQLLPRLHYSQKVLNTQPPQKSPEPTKPGLSLKGDDLNPLMPQFPILVEVLAQCGITISPQAIASAQAAAQNQLLMGMATPTSATGTSSTPTNTEHGGKVAQMESLSKHANELSGGMQGTGQPVGTGAGGIQ